MGELRFFLGLYIEQENGLTNIQQMKYVRELLKKLKLDDVKEISVSVLDGLALVRRFKIPLDGLMNINV